VPSTGLSWWNPGGEGLECHVPNRLAARITRPLIVCRQLVLSPASPSEREHEPGRVSDQPSYHGGVFRPRIAITSSPEVHDARFVVGVDRPYVESVVGAGGLPLILPILSPDFVGDALAGCDGLLLSGGGDIDPCRYGAVAGPEVSGVDAGRDEWELELTRAAVDRGLPILGICRGHQVLNVALGGSLHQHVPALTGEDHHQRSRHGEAVHRVAITEESVIGRVIGFPMLGVNTLHHQAVDVVAERLLAVGWDEEGIVEAVEGTDGLPVLGVQWHPELLQSLPGHDRLFSWLVRAAAPSRSGTVGRLMSGRTRV
jgi:putative glutamine amidotransferase